MPEVPPIPLGGQGNQHFGHFMPQDTIFIWDWDDTLMCSTEMRGTNLLCHGELDELEAIGKYLLENSLKLGDMKIVTNGTADWVRETSTHYLPELLPIVMRYPSVVISARSCYEDEWPGDANAWKLQAFKDVLLSRQSRGQSCKNIIVLGDSFAEINAAQEVSRQLKGPVALKTVKFIEEPSKANLVSQLQAVKNAFTSIVQEPKEAFLTLVPEAPCSPATSFAVHGLCTPTNSCATDHSKEHDVMEKEDSTSFVDLVLTMTPRFAFCCLKRL